MSLTIFLVTIAFIVILQSAMPYLLKRTVVFGVTIPEKHTDDSALSSFKRRYFVIVFFLGLLSLLIYLFWSTTKPITEDQLVLTGLVIQTGTLLVSMALYLYFHAKTTKLKRLNKWGSELKQLRIADLQSHSKDAMLPSFMYVLPMLVSIGLIAYTASQYSLLPDMIPMHWGPDGQADAFSPKTPFSSISLLLILVVFQAMMVGINIAIKQSGIKLNAGKKKSSQLQQLAFRKYSSWLLLMMTILLTILFGFLQLTTIHEEFQNAALMLAVPLGFLLVILLITAIFAFKVGQGGTRLAVSVDEKELVDITNEDNDVHWKLGVFYVNKQDPSIFVEKRFGVGWSINFGNPVGYLILFLPIALVLLITILV